MRHVDVNHATAARHGAARLSVVCSVMHGLLVISTLSAYTVASHFTARLLSSHEPAWLHGGYFGWMGVLLLLGVAYDRWTQSRWARRLDVLLVAGDAACQTCQTQNDPIDMSNMQRSSWCGTSEPSSAVLR